MIASAIAVSPDGAQIAAGGRTTGREHHRHGDRRGSLHISDRPVGRAKTSLAYSPDGGLLASTDEGKARRLISGTRERTSDRTG